MTKREQKIKDMTKLQKTIDELNFDYVNSDITESNFPNEKIRSTDFTIYYPRKRVTSEEVEQHAKKQGLQVANLAELLEYAKEWNGKDFISSLGSSTVVRGRRNVPYLFGWSDERGLGLIWYDDGWDDYCRFLLVGKSSIETSDTLREQKYKKALEEIANSKGPDGGGTFLNGIHVADIAKAALQEEECDEDTVCHFSKSENFKYVCKNHSKSGNGECYLLSEPQECKHEIYPGVSRVCHKCSKELPLPSQPQECEPITKCPVCDGRGNVPNGFYYPHPVSVNATTEPERCKSCEGRGYLK